MIAMETMMTPAERFAAMQALPTHVVYMTRGGGNALITQSRCTIVSSTDEALTISTVSGIRTIPAADVFAVKEGTLTGEEMDAVFAAHAHQQALR